MVAPALLLCDGAVYFGSGEFRCISDLEDGDSFGGVGIEVDLVLAPAGTVVKFFVAADVAGEVVSLAFPLL